MKKDTLISIFLVIVSTFISLSAFEIYLRLYGQLDYYGKGAMTEWLTQYTEQPFFSYRDYSKINSYIKHQSNVSKNTILFIGDSIVFGLGIKQKEDVFSSLSEKTLLAKGYQISILNAGVPAWNIDQILNASKEKLQFVNPDVVIYFLYWNDIDDGKFKWKQQNFQYTDKLYILKLVQFFYNKLFYSAAIGYTSHINNLWAENKQTDIFLQKLDKLQSIYNIKNVPLIIVPLPILFSTNQIDYYKNFVDELKKKYHVYNDIIEYFNYSLKQDMQISIYDPHPNKKAHEIMANIFVTKIFPGLKFNISRKNISKK